MDTEKSLTPDPIPSLSRKPLQKVTNFLLHWGVETHGISPTSVEQRVDKRLYQMFFVWFSANMNVLALSTGSAGPAFFKLGLRPTAVVVVVVDVVSCAIPAFLAVFGPKLGTRAMVQARFSWGYHGAVLPSILNVFSMQGFLIANCIIGGQTLASLSNHLNDTAGIAIIGTISLVVTFFGYKVVHWYETIAWIPNVIALIVMLGLGGNHLKSSEYPTYPPPSAPALISYITFVASTVISWCTMMADYGVYHDAKAPSVRIFTYTYLGLLLPNVTCHLIGAAFAAMAPAVPAWDDGFDDGENLGGLVFAVLSAAGGFGKLLVVLLAISIPSACSISMYTFGTSFMAISPIFARVPQYFFAIVSEAILIPVAIVGAKRFYGTLVNILSIIGYWSTAFSAIVIVEHVVFRGCDFKRYHVDDWDKPKRLPLGFAALLAFFGAIGIVVPSMSQEWFVGPIARSTGDIGVPVGFAAAGSLYTLLRFLELRAIESK